MKHHEGSFLEDYIFQKATPNIQTLRDPVFNRVTLVGLFLWCGFIYKTAKKSSLPGSLTVSSSYFFFFFRRTDAGFKNDLK